MHNIKKLLIALLACTLIIGVAPDVQAQNKKTAKTTKTTKKGGKKGTKGAKTAKPAAAPKPAEPQVVELPYNSTDCLFAIPLQLDKPFGPTTAPDGSGRIMEVVADKAHPNLFEREHNSVWYKVTIPYNGELVIDIMQADVWDDYDFLVYKNTGVYFSNQVMLNKVSPVAVNLSSVDSAALSAAARKAAEQKPKPAGGKKQDEKADEEPVFEAQPALMPTIGMNPEAKDKMLTKKQTGGFIKSIPVRMGEEYYIVLDNCAPNGKGHTINVSVHVNAYEPLVLFYDKKGKRYVDVDLMILEKGGQGGERPIVRNEHYKGGRVKFVPGFSYTLYAKREGYFSVFREFNARDLMMRDTLMLYQMERTERGSSFQIKDIYFEDGEATLIEGYDSVLMDYVAMFRNHPDVTFLVKGYVQSYGVDAEADMLLSLDRAKTVKEYFIKNGIDADRITTAGMTKNEIKRAAAAALDKNGGFSGIKVELIITGKKSDQ
ncbi:MAG: OmpA family protein [Bacteroidales bacterium]|nr:OmpA family protein [Bacteroidales bacterium]